MKMKKILSVLVVFFLCTKAQAQIHEIGVFLGGGNYIGDVGKTTYIAPNELAFGVLYKWNRSPRHAWRISYMQSTISADDLDSEEPGRSLRGYNFENSIKELSLGLEFNFFDFNLHTLAQKFTPYVSSGVNFFTYENMYIELGETKKINRKSSIAIPMILGIKTNISRSLVLGAEVGARYTFSDNLDGSNPKEENLNAFRFGNLNNNDWYVFSGITLTYTFGEKPCYCPQ
ncbi:inorganic polyphosphate/ATP-NAD kinase [Flavobacterium daejeonense]|nr:inorganic polyphosphate/ATP-NAD kinase [Flavobacterium daejeonense]